MTSLKSAKGFSIIRKKSETAIIVLGICIAGFFTAGTIAKVVNALSFSGNRHVRAVLKDKIILIPHRGGKNYKIIIDWKSEKYSILVSKEKWESLSIGDELSMVVYEGTLGYTMVNSIESDSYDRVPGFKQAY